MDDFCSQQRMMNVPGRRGYSNIYEQDIYLALEDFGMATFMGECFWSVDKRSGIIQIANVNEFIKFCGSPHGDQHCKHILEQKCSAQEMKDLELTRYMHFPPDISKLVSLLVSFNQFPMTPEPIKQQVIHYFEQYFYNNLSKKQYPKVYATILAHKIQNTINMYNTNNNTCFISNSKYTHTISNIFKTMFACFERRLKSEYQLNDKICDEWHEIDRRQFGNIPTVITLSKFCFDWLSVSCIKPNYYCRLFQLLNKHPTTDLESLMVVLKLITMLIKNPNLDDLIPYLEFEKILKKLCFAYLRLSKKERPISDGLYCKPDVLQLLGDFHLFHKNEFQIALKCYQIALNYNNNVDFTQIPTKSNVCNTIRLRFNGNVCSGMTLCHMLLGNHEKCNTMITELLKYRSTKEPQFKYTMIHETSEVFFSQMKNQLIKDPNVVRKIWSRISKQYRSCDEHLNSIFYELFVRDHDDCNVNSSNINILKNIAMLKQCNYNKCNRKDIKLKRCKRCLSVFYCSKLCQKRDWIVSHHNCCHPLTRRQLQLTCHDRTAPITQCRIY